MDTIWTQFRPIRQNLGMIQITFRRFSHYLDGNQTEFRQEFRKELDKISRKIRHNLDAIQNLETIQTSSRQFKHNLDGIQTVFRRNQILFR